MDDNNDNDILALTPELLLKAYAVGIFPMAEDAKSDDIFWCDPPMRGVIKPNQFHIPKRLQKTLKQMPFQIRINYNFSDVMDACAESTEKRPNTWINPTIKKLYVELHEMGYAHSVECRDEENRLVGGLYGVCIGGLFFGESMFSRKTDASKIALVHLMARLWAGGFVLLDTQFVTDHLKQFGTTEIKREEYQAYLSKGIRMQCQFLGDFQSSGIASSTGAASVGAPIAGNSPVIGAEGSTGASVGCPVSSVGTSSFGITSSGISLVGSAGANSFFSSEEILLSSFLQSTTQIS